MRSVGIVLVVLLLAGCDGISAQEGEDKPVWPSTVSSPASRQALKGPEPCNLIGHKTRLEVLGDYVEGDSDLRGQCYWRAVKPTLNGPKARTLHVTVVPGPDGS